MLSLRQITRHISLKTLTESNRKAAARCISSSSKTYASDSNFANSTSSEDASLKSTAKPSEEHKPKKKTQAELDQELLLKMRGIDGDGGDAGVEYEDGKPVSMKRSVKNNMFRYI